MEILLRQTQEKPNDQNQPKLPNYAAVSILNPFFQFGNKNLIKALVPYLKFKHGRDRYALAPEVKVKDNAIPDYRKHFTYDYSNPLQRKITPVHTALQFYYLAQSHERHLKNCKRQPKKLKKSSG